MTSCASTEGIFYNVLDSYSIEAGFGIKKKGIKGPIKDIIRVPNKFSNLKGCKVMGRVVSVELKIYLGIIPYWDIKGSYICIEGLGENGTIAYCPIRSVTTRVFTVAFM